MKLKLFLASLIIVAAAFFVNGEALFADGNNSPAACQTPYSTTGDPVTGWDAPPGWIITGVCIKSGSNMFNGTSHSGMLGNGTYESGCYLVEGVGTQHLVVTRLLSGPNCQGISHIDVQKQQVTVWTPTSTATLTPTTTPTATVTKTATPAHTATLTATPTATFTRTPTMIFTRTPTQTRTPMPTLTWTPVVTMTSTPTLTATPTSTPEPTFTTTPMPTNTASPTPTPTSILTTIRTRTAVPPTHTVRQIQTATPTAQILPRGSSVPVITGTTIFYPPNTIYAPNTGDAGLVTID